MVSFVGGLLASLLGGCVGGAVTVTGLSRFFEQWFFLRRRAEYEKQLEDVKADYVAELEMLKSHLQSQQNQLQARLDHSVHVTRTQFETEFQTLKEIFELLAESRLQFSGMRPMFGSSTGNRDEETKRLLTRIHKFRQAHDALLLKTESLIPFYPEELQVLLNGCTRLMRQETGQIKQVPEDLFTVSWYAQGDENRQRFFDQYDQVAQAIRTRINALSVIPGS